MQVPHYTLSTLDDGSCEKLELIVHLPGDTIQPAGPEMDSGRPSCILLNGIGWLTGVDSSAGLAVQIGGRRAFVHLPGRYRLVRASLTFYFRLALLSPHTL